METGVGSPISPHLLVVSTSPPEAQWAQKVTLHIALGEIPSPVLALILSAMVKLWLTRFFDTLLSKLHVIEVEIKFYLYVRDLAQVVAQLKRHGDGRGFPNFPSSSLHQKRKGYFAYCPGGNTIAGSCAYPFGYGQALVDTVLRHSSAFKGANPTNILSSRALTHTTYQQDWVANYNRINMLENAEICDEEVTLLTHPAKVVDSDGLGFNVTYDADWMSIDDWIEWTYVTDLDNLDFIINGTVYFNLDELPLYLDDYPYDDTNYIRRGYGWPGPNFDTEVCQQNYEALRPMIIPANEWGVPTWDELSVSQQFSIEITHQLLRKMPGMFEHAYAPSIRSHVGAFCWCILLEHNLVVG
ncbi:hypothetical protein RSAG8_06818, partial [Rhizoctonia solani AG-8 WAC10335]